jgi:hypothetical protein
VSLARYQDRTGVLSNINPETSHIDMKMLLQRVFTICISETTRHWRQPVELILAIYKLNPITSIVDSMNVGSCFLIVHGVSTLSMTMKLLLVLWIPWDSASTSPRLEISRGLPMLLSPGRSVNDLSKPPRHTSRQLRCAAAVSAGSIGFLLNNNSSAIMSYNPANINIFSGYPTIFM